MIPLPQTPEQFLQSLFEIFPKFRIKYRFESGEEPASYHTILIEFSYYFGKDSHSFSQAQLRNLGELINQSVAKEGPLENAFRTCFLEHLHQIKATRVLLPHLSKLARQKTRA